MKISKTRLKEIIKEELSILREVNSPPWTDTVQLPQSRIRKGGPIPPEPTGNPPAWKSQEQNNPAASSNGVWYIGTNTRGFTVPKDRPNEEFNKDNVFARAKLGAIEKDEPINIYDESPVKNPIPVYQSHPGTGPIKNIKEQIK